MKKKKKFEFPPVLGVRVKCSQEFLNESELKVMFSVSGVVF